VHKGLLLISREQNWKPLVYLLKMVGLAPYFLNERIFRKFRPSTLLSIYTGVMLLIFLFIRLELIVGNSFNNNLYNVYTLAAMM